MRISRKKRDPFRLLTKYLPRDITEKKERIKRKLTLIANIRNLAEVKKNLNGKTMKQEEKSKIEQKITQERDGEEKRCSKIN